MAKELPYFRFTVQEWQNGKISTLNDSLKGVFIDLCCYYWAQNCNVTFDSIICKFKTKSKSIQKLIESQTICNQNGIVSISFLDQQLTELKQNKTFFSEMGKLGQIAKKSQAPLISDLSYKDKDKDKDKDNKRGLKFTNPTIEDVTEYCTQRKSIVDPVKFFHGYESKNWMVGKSKMKDWKKAVINWEVNKWGLADVKQQPETQPPPNFILEDHVRVFESKGYENYKQWCGDVGQPIRLDKNKKRTDI